MDIYVNPQTFADILAAWGPTMEKQAVVKPGVTPDLEPKAKCTSCERMRQYYARMREKQAQALAEQDEIQRLAQQDAATRLAEDVQ